MFIAPQMIIIIKLIITIPNNINNSNNDFSSNANRKLFKLENKYINKLILVFQEQQYVSNQNQYLQPQNLQQL